MHELAREKDSSEHEMWVTAFCWYYGIEYSELDGLSYAQVDKDFSEYLHTLFQEEAVPAYVRHFADTFKKVVMEA